MGNCRTNWFIHWREYLVAEKLIQSVINALYKCGLFGKETKTDNNIYLLIKNTILERSS